METELTPEDHVRWEDIRGLSWFFIDSE